MNKRIKKILKRNQVYLNYFTGIVIASIGVFFAFSEYKKTQTEHLINQFEHSPKIGIHEWYYVNDKGNRVREGISISNEGYALSNFNHTLYSFIRVNKKNNNNCILSSRLIPVRGVIGIESIFNHHSSGELVSCVIQRQEFAKLQQEIIQYDNYDENYYYELECVVLLKAAYKDYKNDAITSYHCLDNQNFGTEIPEETAKDMIKTIKSADIYELDQFPISDFI